MLKVNYRVLRTHAEVARQASGVKVYSVEQLATLYAAGTEQVRLMMLLALNCGFTQADLHGLQQSEVDLEGSPPMIRRIRHKSGVYGEHTLWPETVAALRRVVQSRRRVKAAEPGYFLVTPRGELYNRPRISNAWNRLLDLVTTAAPGFPRLSFKYLRKTAATPCVSRATAKSRACSCVTVSRSPATSWRTFTATARLVGWRRRWRR